MSQRSHQMKRPGTFPVFSFATRGKLSFLRKERGYMHLRCLILRGMRCSLILLGMRWKQRWNLLNFLLIECLLRGKVLNLMTLRGYNNEGTELQKEIFYIINQKVLISYHTCTCVRVQMLAHIWDIHSPCPHISFCRLKSQGSEHLHNDKQSSQHV